jgi:ASPIC and UnbV/FG-GAP-like repeat
MRLLHRHAAHPLDRALPCLAAWLLTACGAAPAVRTDAESVRFTLVTGVPATTDLASSGSGQWVDVDGDGDLDLFVANGYDVSGTTPGGQADRLYLNDGRGSLGPVEGQPIVADSVPSSQGTWGDFDNDGDVDVFVAVQGSRNNLLYRNDGRGDFTPVTTGPPVEDGGASFAASWVDVDADGRLDLFVSNGGLAGAGRNFLYRGLGDATFERAPDSPITTDTAVNVGGSWADYDDDGDMDLFVAHRASRFALHSALYRNDGAWTFTRVQGDPIVSDTTGALAAAWGDYDNDGDLDLAVGTFAGQVNRLFRNDGGGRFTRVLDGGPHVVDGNNSYGMMWADADNDGDLDLLAINWGSPSFLYTNLGGGRFERREHGDLGRVETVGAAGSWGDYDGDGDLDLYIASWPDFPNGRQANQLYRNDAPAGNHWLQVTLVGTRSNRSAIGARITARATIGGRVVQQLREVVAHTGFRSQDPLTQHVGLGDATRVETLVVRWPSGAVQTFRDVAADRRITITEGDDVVR